MRAGPHVLVFPAYDENPFLNLLALAPRAAGFRFLGSDVPRSLLRQLDSLAAGDVCHIHWTTPLLQQSADRRDAENRLRRLQRGFRRAHGRGVRFIWTVHNRLPHELRFPDLERRLYQLLADVSAAVHVMHPDTRRLVADVVALDHRRVRQIPHPSYEGIYETGVTREAARTSFDLSSHQRAALFLGQIRPYKGVDALVRAATLLQGSDPEVVLMLGGVVKEMSREEFARSIPERVAAVQHFDFVPDGELARWFRAADVAVFPYRSILNSGSVHLAATFRRPVLLPDEPHLRDQFGGEAWVGFFDPNEPDRSIAALLGAPDLFADVSDASFDGFLAGISPWDISRTYAALLSELSGGSAAA